MKLSVLLLLAFSAALSTVSAAQVWVDGVSAEHGGWIDYEKNPTKGDGDDLLCWAASASNIIDYWQQRYVVPVNTPTGGAIWETFKSSCAMDTGGRFVSAMQWWLGGDYEGTTLDNDDETAYSLLDNRAVYRHPLNEDVAIETDLNDFDGYYWDCFSYEYEGKLYTNGKQAHLFNFLYGFASYSSIEEKLIAELAAPMSLSIVDTNKELAHAITLWGLDYTEDDSGNVSINSIWITDSDDYSHQLRQIFTYYQEGDSSTIYLKGYSDYPLYGDIYLTGALGINLAESDTWNLVRAVPEPTTATLSLLALAGLAMRRRRK